MNGPETSKIIFVDSKSIFLIFIILELDKKENSVLNKYLIVITNLIN